MPTQSGRRVGFQTRITTPITSSVGTGIITHRAKPTTLFSSSDTFAQYQASMQWRLPKGAKARLGKGKISEVVYSPDGTRLAVASGIGIWLYDAQTGEELDLLTGDYTHILLSVAFSPDGNTLASASTDGTLLLWELTPTPVSQK